MFVFTVSAECAQQCRREHGEPVAPHAAAENVLAGTAAAARAEHVSRAARMSVSVRAQAIGRDGALLQLRSSKLDPVQSST